ncbi:hypothetical protein EW146_g4194 [Bondarzewia mesenterica]|uniref:Alpha/beta hydrolase fold-3 domain-containing protein n=1 Tax=Bondarzewia mesenterica TaxID=1095465 RepID=A0A4S4LX37_9AGAM|nr:hypothetical protein EW146_g4194 [Bondarzewia mesenterica]
MVSLSSCNRAADLLIDWFGPEQLKTVVGGERWWQVRGLDGIAAEWITEWRFLNGAKVAQDGERLDDGEETIRKMENLESVMLYVHGGGYSWGSINTHRYQVIRYAHKFHGRAFTVNYRKAPQYPWPCPLHDVLAAYFYLTDPPPGVAHKRIPASKIVFAGDSAGGGLCVTALTVLRDMGLPLPSGAVLISPWVDLTHSFPSVMSNSDTDIIPPHGFIHKPSTTWPVDPIPLGGRVHVMETMNTPPPPGHADNLTPGQDRLSAQHVVNQAQKEDKLVGQVMMGGTRREGGFLSQDEKLKILKVRASPETGEGRGLGVSMDEECETNGPTGSGDQHEEDCGLSDDEDLEKWEPKPPKVLMEDPDATPLELRAQIQQYATNEQLVHPLVSPILQGSLGNLCPLYILTGDGEVLRDEIIYLAHRAAHPDEYPARRGVLREGIRQSENAKKFTTPTKVHLQVFDGMPHVLTVFMFTNSAKYAYYSIAQFVKHVTLNPPEHLVRNPFPELHRPQRDLPLDEYSPDDSSSENRHERRHQKRPSRCGRRTKSRVLAKNKAVDKEEVKLYRRNEEEVAQEVKKDEADKLAEFGQVHLDTLSMEHAEDQSEDIPHILMIRERVDIRGNARAMEPKEEIPVLQLRPSEVGVIKEAPVRRWLTGQEHTDKVFSRTAKKAVKKRKKIMKKFERMLADARDQGLVLEGDKNVKTGRGQGDSGDAHAGWGGAREMSKQVGRVGTGASNAPIGSMDTGRVIDENRRWGPLDLDNEHPPFTAIAKRRDTPEALALLKKTIYHSPPATHLTVPKMKRMQTVRATLNPNDHPVKPPRQSVSEQQVSTHIVPMHGLSIWNSIVTLFMRKSKKTASQGKKQAVNAIERTLGNGSASAGGSQPQSSKLHVNGQAS